MFVSKVYLKVLDINRSLEFYQDIMGFKILDRKDKIAVLTVDGFSPIITIEQPEDVVEKIPRRTGLYHFALLLPKRIDLGLFLKHISNKKHPIIGGSNHGVSEALYLEDPDNNGIEVYIDRDPSTWKWTDDMVTMTNKPLDYDNLIVETGDQQWDNMPRETIMGHIHLHVGDLEASEKFYVDGLGFDLVMEMGKSALFLSTGGYHHHIGLNIWNGKGAEPLPNNSVGMKFYTIKFPDIVTREDTVYNLKKLGYEIMINNEDIFTKDPSKNLIQLSL